MASYRLWGDRIFKTVILDSNAIMMLFEFSLDLERELTRLLGSYHIVVPTSVIQELELLSKHAKGNKKTKAQASLQLIQKYDIQKSDKQNVDESIVTLAKQTNGIVVTNDKELKNRLKEHSLSVIFLRAKKKLALE
jgi:rRNA-processing protein FCF1